MLQLKWAQTLESVLNVVRKNGDPRRVPPGYPMSIADDRPCSRSEEQATRRGTDTALLDNAQAECSRMAGEVAPAVSFRPWPVPRRLPEIPAILFLSTRIKRWFLATDRTLQAGNPGIKSNRTSARKTSCRNIMSWLYSQGVQSFPWKAAGNCWKHLSAVAADLIPRIYREKEFRLRYRCHCHYGY